jgi:phosphohistidine phosphatase
MKHTELYLIRHGIAAERNPDELDGDRPLTDLGRQKTHTIAKRLHKLGFHVQLLLTSPLVRARQTAEILLQVGLSDTLEESPELAPEGSLEQWLGWFQEWQQQGDRLALVGHEPDLSTWAEQLIWGSVQHRLVLKKMGIIGLQVPLQNPLGSCTLTWLTPPKWMILPE